MIERTKKIPLEEKYYKNLKSIEMPPQDFIYIPTTNDRCAKSEVTIKDGDAVKIGTQLGVRDGKFFKQPFFSTVSGKVVGREKMFHPTGKLVECIKIENDKKEETYNDGFERTDSEIKALTKDQVVSICEKFGLVGMGGSAFPTFIKLGTKEKIKAVVINAVECEPYLHSDIMSINQNSELMLKGLSLVLNIFRAPEGKIAIKVKHPKVIEKLQKEIAAFGDKRISISVVKDYYPAGWEISMFRDVVKEDIPSGTLPMQRGYLGLNSTTAMAIYYACKYELPMTVRNFSVTGPGIKTPIKSQIKIGTDIRNVIEAAGGYKGTSDKVLITGGPMMGSSLVRDNIVASVVFTSLLVFDTTKEKEETCIRCASCNYSCPAYLQPQQIMIAAKTKNSAAIEKFNVKACVECGMCTYTCTSKIHLTEWMRKAKKLVK